MNLLVIAIVNRRRLLHYTNQMKSNHFATIYIS